MLREPSCALHHTIDGPPIAPWHNTSKLWLLDREPYSTCTIRQENSAIHHKFSLLQRREPQVGYSINSGSHGHHMAAATLEKKAWGELERGRWKANRS
jgi:hypothetical protein